jgi:ribosomal protein L6P/L9E
MVREISASEEVVIPEGVSVDVKARHVVVKGKRGTLERSFKHASVEMTRSKTKKGQDCIKVGVHMHGRWSRNGVFQLRDR